MAIVGNGDLEYLGGGMVKEQLYPENRGYIVRELMEGELKDDVEIWGVGNIRIQASVPSMQPGC